MMQAEINRAVARVTGESRRMVARRGFSLEPPSSASPDGVQIGFNCPGCGSLIPIPLTPLGPYLSEAECASCDVVYDIDPHALFVIDTLHAPQPAFA
jgi:hypothetical protein